MTPKVLLTDTTRYSCATRLAFAFAAAGIEVSAVLPIPGHPLLKARALCKTFPYSGLHPLDSVRAAIEATAPQMIVPCDDAGVQHLHDLHAQASTHGESRASTVALIERSLGPPESYPIVSSRYDLLKIAHDEGLCVADTSRINTVADLKRWGEGRKLPWVLKADGTWGGQGVRIAYTLAEAEQLFLQLSRPVQISHLVRRLIVSRDPFVLLPWWRRSKPAIVAQSHIQGRPANCAVVCQAGRVLAKIAVEVVSSQGPTGPAMVVRVVEGQQMMICAETIARRLQLNGYFGLDFVIEEDSNKAYLIEMNPRPTPLCHLQLGKGRDMVDALWAQLSGQPLREPPPVTQDDLITYFPQAWHGKGSSPPQGFLDVPSGELVPISDILRPWPDRSLLAVSYTKLRKFYLHAKSLT